MNFSSDNAAGIAPEILAALAAANDGRAMAYGNDAVSERLALALADCFETTLAAFPVATGTAANALALATLSPPWGLIYCHRHAHVEEDEAGAPEFFSAGAKLHLLDGDHGLKLHMDGARFANAVAFLGCAPADLTWRAGVDVLSFGATKNGAMAAEAVVFFDPDLAGEMRFRRKRAGHLFSKMRFLSAQLEAYLADDAWLRYARHANTCARALAEGLAALPGAALVHPVEANEVFIRLPEPVIAGMQGDGVLFHPWAPDGPGAVRLVTAFDTDPADVDAAIAVARRHASEAQAT